MPHSQHFIPVARYIQPQEDRQFSWILGSRHWSYRISRDERVDQFIDRAKILVMLSCGWICHISFLLCSVWGGELVGVGGCIPDKFPASNHPWTNWWGIPMQQNDCGATQSVAMVVGVIKFLSLLSAFPQNNRCLKMHVLHIYHSSYHESSLYSLNLTKSFGDSRQVDLPAVAGTQSGVSGFPSAAT